MTNRQAKHFNPSIDFPMDLPKQLNLAANQAGRCFYYYAGQLNTPPLVRPKKESTPTDSSKFLEDTYFNFARALYDPNFFERLSEEDEKKAPKINKLVCKAGIAFQNTIDNTLSTKNAAGDYSPKPTMKIVLKVAEEMAFFTAKNAANIIPRIGTSQAFLYAACIGGALIALTDDTARSMLIEQINNLTSTISSNNADKQDVKYPHATQSLDKKQPQ